MLPAAIDGMSIGVITDANVRKGRAPRSLEASSSDGGRRSSPA